MTDEHTPGRIRVWAEEQWENDHTSMGQWREKTADGLWCLSEGEADPDAVEYVRADIADELLEALEQIAYQNTTTAKTLNDEPTFSGMAMCIHTTAQVARAAIAKARGQRDG